MVMIPTLVNTSKTPIEIDSPKCLEGFVTFMAGFFNY